MVVKGKKKYPAFHDYNHFPGVLIPKIDSILLICEDNFLFQNQVIRHKICI